MSEEDGGHAIVRCHGRFAYMQIKEPMLISPALRKLRNFLRDLRKPYTRLTSSSVRFNWPQAA